MHAEAEEFVRSCVAATLSSPLGVTTVLDVGGRNVNGSNRDLFFEVANRLGVGVIYSAVDVRPGEGVDFLVDFSEEHLHPSLVSGSWDVVVSTEVFEHAPRWKKILRNMAAACAPGGHLIVTCAAPGRPAHSAVDGAPLTLSISDPEQVDDYSKPTDSGVEWYRNVSIEEILHEAQAVLGLTTVAAFQRLYWPQDSYLLARKEYQ